jgi:hypothetical protein
METDTMSFGAIITYALLMLFMFIAGSALGQNPCNSDICVVQFNASWNGSNSVDYLDKLTECDVMNVSIDEGTWQKDYGIVVVPTIIVFNGEEVERFQANIMMQIEATRKEVQGVVDEILMDSF